MPRIAPLLRTAADPKTGATLDAIKAKLGTVPNLFSTLAHSPPALNAYLGLSETLSKGVLTPRQREIIALAVSVTNSCRYCINSHTAAVQKLGLDNEALGEVLAVVGLYNQMNKLADAYQVEPDILPEVR